MTSPSHIIMIQRSEILYSPSWSIAKRDVFPRVKLMVPMLVWLWHVTCWSPSRMVSPRTCLMPHSLWATRPSLRVREREREGGCHEAGRSCWLDPTRNTKNVQCHAQASWLINTPTCKHKSFCGNHPLPDGSIDSSSVIRRCPSYPKRSLARYD